MTEPCVAFGIAPVVFFAVKGYPFALVDLRKFILPVTEAEASEHLAVGIQIIGFKNIDYLIDPSGEHISLGVFVCKADVNVSHIVLLSFIFFRP